MGRWSGRRDSSDVSGIRVAQNAPCECKHRLNGRTALALGEIGLRMVEEREQRPDPGVLAAMPVNLAPTLSHGTYKMVPFLSLASCSRSLLYSW